MIRMAKAFESCYIVGNFQGVQFLQIDNLYCFVGLISADMRARHVRLIYIISHTLIYCGFNLSVNLSSAIIGPLEITCYRPTQCSIQRV